jgi:hypothetical protein
MVQIDDAAGATEVAFDSITVGTGDGAAATGPSGFASSPFTFAFEGSYFSLSDFVDRLERFVAVNDSRIDVTGRLLAVNTLNLSVGESFPRISADITGTAYVLADGGAATEGATAVAPAGVTPSAETPAADTTTAPTTTATVTGVIR